MNSNTPAIQDENISTSPEVFLNVKNERWFNFISILSIILGFGLFIWIILNTNFINNDGTLNSKVCLVLNFGLAITLNGLLFKTKWKTFAVWTGLALIGHSASLQMIDAGRTIHFQHYRPLTELFNSDLLTLVLFLAQIVLVAIGISFLLGTIKNWLTKTFTRWQLIAILLFTFFAGAAVTRDISVYISSLLIGAVVGIVNLANVILVAFSIPRDSVGWLHEKIEKLFSNSDGKVNVRFRIDRFAIFTTLWVILLTGTLSYFVYQRHPHVPDESIYLFQANYMAAGQLTAKAPLVPEAFSVYMIPTQESRWFSIFPPAWSALLAIGLKLNLEWLINPILAGLCILLTYILFQDFYSRSFARIGIILLSCSPWFIFMSMSFMSHIFTLFCALGATVLLNKSLNKSKIGYAFGAGLLIGVLSLIRPLDGVMIAGLLGIWTLIKFPNLRSKILTSIALIIGTITTGALVFPYNKSITGNSFLLPMDYYYTKYFWKNANSLGFGSDRGMGWELDAFPGHSPFEAILNAALNTFSVNIELFGWGFGSLLLVICFIFSGGLKKKDIWALATLFVVIGGYSLFWYHGGPDFGARYWFLIIIPLLALTVRSFEWLSEKINNTDLGKNTFNPNLILTLGTICAISMIAYFPWRSVDKYYHYLGMRPDIRELSQQNNFGKNLILVRGNEHPDYESGWVYNPLNFEGDSPVYAWDKNPEIRTQLLKAYSDRKVWLVDAPSITNSGYQIKRGPIEANELLKEENQ